MRSVRRDPRVPARDTKPQATDSGANTLQNETNP
jgi:hypothetical protein